MLVHPCWSRFGRSAQIVPVWWGEAPRWTPCPSQFGGGSAQIDSSSAGPILDGESGTTVVTIIPSPLQRLHGFGYNGIVRIHLSTWLVLQLEGSVHSVPRDVTLPSLDIYKEFISDESTRASSSRRWRSSEEFQTTAEFERHDRRIAKVQRSELGESIHVERDQGPQDRLLRLEPNGDQWNLGSNTNKDLRTATQFRHGAWRVLTSPIWVALFIMRSKHHRNRVMHSLTCYHYTVHSL